MQGPLWKCTDASFSNFPPAVTDCISSRLLSASSVCRKPYRALAQADAWLPSSFLEFRGINCLADQVRG